MRTLLALTAMTSAAVLVAAPAAGAGEDEDQQIADEAVLTLADLPDGWEEGDPPDEEDPAKGLVPACRAIERAVEEGDEQPRAESPDFDDTNDPNAVASVSNEVIVFPKVKGAKRYLKPFKADGEDCLLGRAEEFPGVVDASIEEIEVTGFGDDAHGYTVFVTVESNGEEFTFANDLVVVRVGRAVASFVTENLDDPLPDGPDIADVVVSRLEDAL
ncbi:MAG TPA: hypothetical protein VF152_13310 [Acidimicrobiia bacterium]